MRFLADENVSRWVIDKLRLAGFDVISIAEVGQGSSDKDVVGMANAEGRILVTEDRDFREIVVRQRLGVAGVILLELDRLSNLAEADRVTEIVSAHTSKLAGHLVVVEPGRIRIRRLQ